MKRLLIKSIRSPHTALTLGDITSKPAYSRIAIALDFSNIDTEIIRHALSLGNQESKIIIIHIVESAGAMILGQDIGDYETVQDDQVLAKYQAFLQEKGYETSVYLGFGNPKTEIPKSVNEFNADLLVMGAHGHKMLKDIIFGTTVDTVRHKVKIPVFIVKHI